MPKPLMITLKEGVDPVYGLQKVPAPKVGAIFEGQYILMPEIESYSKGVRVLKEACKAETDSPHPQFVLDDGSRIYRPLTFHENLRARVEDFNRKYDELGTQRTLDDRLRLFARCLDSCTGIAYKKDTSEMKIIPVSQDLIEIDADVNFGRRYLSVDYNSLDGEELYRGKGMYNVLLTREEAIEHPGWLATVNGDKALLKEHASIVFAQLKEKYNRDTGMKFWVRCTTEEDELRALFVSDLSNNSYAYVNNYLYDNGSFLLVAPFGAP